MTVTSAAPTSPADRLSFGFRAVFTVCLLVSAASLALPAAIGFDPWSWLVWGREVTNLELDTTGGPSWKPLPVVITTLLAPLGSLAPAVWTVVARTAGLLLVVGTFRLAHRFAGSIAGVLTIGLLVLTPDGEPRFLRTLLEAHGAPMTAAFAIWAIDRHLEGRWTSTLALGTGLALMRPESWPFLALYAVWLWRRHPSQRRAVLPALVVVPTLWFGGDLWGAGNPLHGADAAQVASADAAGRAVDSVRTAAGMVVAPVWAAAAVAVVTARRRGERQLVWAAGLAVLWSAVVVAMAIGTRYAAVSRFFLPAAAVVTVLAAIGIVRLARTVPRTTAGFAGTTAVMAVAIVLALPRVLGLADVTDEVRARATLQADLDSAIESAGGRASVLSCGPVAVDGATLLRPAVAWKLDVPLGTTRRVPHARPGVWFTVTGGRTDRSASVTGAEVLTRTESWTVRRVGCPLDTPRNHP